MWTKTRTYLKALTSSTLAVNKIWIRADYICIYDFLEKQYDEAAKVDLEPGVVQEESMSLLAIN
jgi:hypothetical protein